MAEEIEEACEPGITARSLGDRRVVAPAWLVAIVLVLLFTAADALASRHSAPSREGAA